MHQHLSQKKRVYIRGFGHCQNWQLPQPSGLLNNTLQWRAGAVSHRSLRPLGVNSSSAGLPPPPRRVNRGFAAGPNDPQHRVLIPPRRIRPGEQGRGRSRAGSACRLAEGSELGSFGLLLWGGCSLLHRNLSDLLPGPGASWQGAPDRKGPRLRPEAFFEPLSLRVAVKSEQYGAPSRRGPSCPARSVAQPPSPDAGTLCP